MKSDVMVKLIGLFFLLLTTSALADPPDNADPALAPWFQSLQQPGTGISCCSISDCRPTEWRTNKDGNYEALISTPNTTESRWIDIPPEKVLQRNDNPTGRAILCWRPSTGVMCFVRGTET